LQQSHTLGLIHLIVERWRLHRHQTPSPNTDLSAISTAAHIPTKSIVNVRKFTAGLFKQNLQPVVFLDEVDLSYDEQQFLRALIRAAHLPLILSGTNTAASNFLVRYPNRVSRTTSFVKWAYIHVDLPKVPSQLLPSDTDIRQVLMPILKPLSHTERDRIINFVHWLADVSFPAWVLANVLAACTNCRVFTGYYFPAQCRPVFYQSA
jgi:hypothetical protein